MTLNDEREPSTPTAVGRRFDAAPPILDPETISRLGTLGDAIGEDLLSNLASLFLADAEAQIAELSRALDRHDHSGVVRGAHTLRGSSANLGATDLGRACARLETAGAEGDLTNGGSLLDAVTTELSRARGALAPWIATL